MNIKTYKTSDLPLATTLLYFDFVLSSLDKTDSKRVIFIFQKTSKLEKVIDDYWKGKIEVEPQKIFQIQKGLKTRLYSEE